MKNFLSKFLLIVAGLFGATTFGHAQGSCIFFPLPGEYQNQPNATNVYRVASGINASGTPVTTTPISTDSTLATTVTQPANVPQSGSALQICAPAGPYTIQFNTSNVGGGFFNYNFIIPADATKTVASVFKVVDGTDNTKVIVFQSSGATTATTLTLADSSTVNRTLTFPDATDTLVGKATTDTLTNKTLTSPVIATGLTASGSAANDFSGSTGAFKPSTGTFTFQATAVAASAGANNFDLSASSGTFKTTTGVGTFGGSSNSFSGAVTITPTASLTLGTAGSAVGQAIFNNATSGTITLAPPTGALGSVTAQLPDTTGGMPVVINCGAVAAAGACANTNTNGTAHIFYGLFTLSGNSSLATGLSPAFTSTTSFACNGTTSTGTAATIKIANTSASTITITNPGGGATDTVSVICIGN